MCRFGHWPMVLCKSLAFQIIRINFSGRIRTSQMNELAPEILPRKFMLFSIPVISITNYRIYWSGPDGPIQSRFIGANGYENFILV